MRFDTAARLPRLIYRVTGQLVQNLPLTSKQKFRFGLARPGQARPKRNFYFEVNSRFCTSCSVTLYLIAIFAKIFVENNPYLGALYFLFLGHLAERLAT